MLFISFYRIQIGEEGFTVYLLALRSFLLLLNAFNSIKMLEQVLGYILENQIKLVLSPIKITTKKGSCSLSISFLL
jgi:hypothetical protein